MTELKVTANRLPEVYRSLLAVGVEERIVSLTGSWLKAHFILLLTATPFFNDIRDFMGYDKLLLPSNPEVTQRMSGPRIAQLLNTVPQSTEQSILCSREFVEARGFGKDIDSQVLP
ncbi:uncharacterized protein BO96DRAFT_345905 [Aspergillus niger CBS 101883]|uniref:uncharacterized protein n=1 Tax=Aspergillus lacticoffeatus (strain CBS 101883) TaxID=1450533 RepID=UPI000D8031CC|nr:uncharacterized protein BO96DRAFT_345905 [Aspergillus niger CBS 101883]PYH53090.1 hypothetical protein BO96DRAFT_345905 [Aspergillus niger CBS 101883]